LFGVEALAVLAALIPSGPIKDQGSSFICIALEWFERGFFMFKWSGLIQRFLVEEDGPTAVEYAVMLALIVVVCIVAITTVGSNANQVFSNVALNTAAGSAAS
jgi:pilus assembly protein Flp/PilA